MIGIIWNQTSRNNVHIYICISYYKSYICIITCFLFKHIHIIYAHCGILLNFRCPFSGLIQHPTSRPEIFYLKKRAVSKSPPKKNQGLILIYFCWCFQFSWQVFSHFRCVVLLYHQHAPGRPPDSSRFTFQVLMGGGGATGWFSSPSDNAFCQRFRILCLQHLPLNHSQSLRNPDGA